MEHIRRENQEKVATTLKSMNQLWKLASQIKEEKVAEAAASFHDAVPNAPGVSSNGMIQMAPDQVMRLVEAVVDSVLKRRPMLANGGLVVLTCLFCVSIHPTSILYIIMNPQ